MLAAFVGRSSPERPRHRERVAPGHVRSCDIGCVVQAVGRARLRLHAGRMTGMVVHDPVSTGARQLQRHVVVVECQDFLRIDETVVDRARLEVRDRRFEWLGDAAGVAAMHRTESKLARPWFHEPRMPADLDGRRFVSVDRQLVMKRGRSQSDGVINASGVRPVRPERGREHTRRGVGRDDGPGVVEDRSVNRVRWHTQRKLNSSTLEREPTVSNPTGVRNHGIRTPAQ